MLSSSSKSMPCSWVKSRSDEVPTPKKLLQNSSKIPFKSVSVLVVWCAPLCVWCLQISDMPKQIVPKEKNNKILTQLLKPAMSPNGWQQFESCSWIFWRTLGDIASHFLWQQNTVFFMDSLTISICDSGDQNRYTKPNHDVFKTLAKCFCAWT